MAAIDRELETAQELEIGRAIGRDWIPTIVREEAAIPRGIDLTTVPEIGLIGSTDPVPATTSSTIARTG